MNRKKFIENGLLGFGAIVAVPTILSACSKNSEALEENSDTSGTCTSSPSETKGPFPILTPSQLVKSSIIGDREGVALLMTFTVTDLSEGCTPLPEVWVDVWHCDKDGNYSEYGAYSSYNFLRGRQLTDVNGQVSFLSIFPGWYRGRAPHLHIEILHQNGTSLLVTQVAFPTSTYTAVYASSGYNGAPDTSNSQDSIFSNSLEGNMADAVTGNITDGYTLVKTIVVP